MKIFNKIFYVIILIYLKKIKSQYSEKLFYFEYKNLLTKYNITITKYNNEEFYNNFLYHSLNIINNNYENKNLEYELNSFALMCDKEFDYYYLYNNKHLKYKYLRGYNFNNTFIHNKIDWRIQTDLNDVVKQDKYIYSWIYILVELVEVTYNIEYNHSKIIKLSVLDLIDYFDYDYNGFTDFDNAYFYIKKNGLSIENNINFLNNIYINNYYLIPNNNQEEIMHMLSKHPLLVNIYISKITLFKFYKKGIIKYSQYYYCDNNFDHTVLLVGYGIENNTKYWILKNTWGKEWGENGYFRMEIEKKNSTCNLFKYISYVKLN